MSLKPVSRCAVCYDDLWRGDPYTRWGENESDVCFRCLHPQTQTVLPVVGDWWAIYTRSDTDDSMDLVPVIGWHFDHKRDKWQPIVIHSEMNIETICEYSDIANPIVIRRADMLPNADEWARLVAEDKREREEEERRAVSAAAARAAKGTAT